MSRYMSFISHFLFLSHFRPVLTVFFFFFFSLTGSINDGSIDEESGFDEGQDATNDISASVTKFICRFVDRVCTETCIDNDHTKVLLDKIAQLVHMQVCISIFTSSVSLVRPEPFSPAFVQ